MEKFEKHINRWGKKKGVAALMKEKVLGANGGQPMKFRCIMKFRQQALCEKVLNWRHLMSVVVSNVNFIESHALNHRQFQTFLADLDCEYGYVMYHNEVRWLRKGKKEEADFIADLR